jgi:hypothetical protein
MPDDDEQQPDRQRRLRHLRRLAFTPAVAAGFRRDSGVALRCTRR